MMSGAQTHTLVANTKKKFSGDKKRGCQKCKLAETKCPKPGKLGNLSKHYESGERGSEAISPGKGDAGGRSYGAYQLASKKGQVGEFIKYVQSRAPDVAQALSKAGGSTAAINGNKTFQDEWRRQAREGGDSFLELQHDFIRDTHYTPVANTLRERHHLDISQRSAALQDVVWSVAVQHGPGSGGKVKRKDGTLKDGVLEGALRGRDVSKMADSEIINAIYDYRGKYWPKEKDGRQKRERECALRALEEETSTGKESKTTSSTSKGFTPEESDKLITSKHGKHFTDKRKSANLAQTGTHLYDDKDFKAEYIKAFGDDGEYEFTNAFANSQTGQIYIHKDRANGGTTLHEANHLYTHPAFPALGTQITEGTTEYFTRQETPTRGIDRTGIYDEEYSAIERLAALVGNERLEAAYYSGEVTSLRQSVDQIAGSGTFDKFKQAMQSKDFKTAKNLLTASK